MAKSIDVSDLNIYYGDFLAVAGRHDPDRRVVQSPPSSGPPAVASPRFCAR